MAKYDDAFEMRKKEIANKRKAAKKRRKQALLKKLFILFIVIIILTVLVLSLTIFFPLKSIVVKGDSIYSSEQIIKASGIEKDKNLWLTGLNAEEEITVKLPFISSANIIRKLPGNIVIEVKKAVAEFSYQTKNGYLVCDSNGKVLQNKGQAAENTTQILGSTANTVKEGNMISFNDEEISNLIKLINDALKKHNISVNMIDVSTKVKIVLKVENRFSVELGSSAYLDAKVNHLSGMIKELANDRKGNIDLSEYSPENPTGILTRE